MWPRGLAGGTRVAQMRGFETSRDDRPSIGGSTEHLSKPVSQTL